MAAAIMMADNGVMLDRLNARLAGVAGSEAADIRDGVLTAYIPASVAWRGRAFDEDVLAEVQAAISARREGLFGLGVEIGSGSIKLFGRRWQGGEGTTLVNIKLQTPHGCDADDYIPALNRLIDVFCAGLRLIPRDSFDPAAPEAFFDGFRAPEDFACVYGTHAVRVLARNMGSQALSRVRVLSGDEEGLIAFAAIVPAEYRNRPGTVAVEIGSGSTEIVCVAGDGRAHALTLAIGGKTADPPLKGLQKFLATGIAGRRIERLLDSRPEAVAAFIAASREPAGALFINASRASAGFRAFAAARVQAGEVIAITEEVVLAYRHEHPNSAYAAKALLLLAIMRGLGVDGFREGHRGGLKMGVAALLARGLARFTG